VAKMNDDIAPGFKDYVALGIMSGVTALFGYFKTRHSARFKALEDYNIAKEIADRAEREKADEHCEKCKASILEAMKTTNKELVETFQEGLKTERLFRVEVMKEQGFDI